MDGYLVCKGGTYPAQLMYQDLADRACEIITAAITNSRANGYPVKALLDSFNPTGSTAHVNFSTSKAEPLGDGFSQVPCELDRPRQRLGG